MRSAIAIGLPLYTAVPVLAPRIAESERAAGLPCAFEPILPTARRCCAMDDGTRAAKAGERSTAALRLATCIDRSMRCCVAAASFSTCCCVMLKMYRERSLSKAAMVQGRPPTAQKIAGFFDHTVEF